MVKEDGPLTEGDSEWSSEGWQGQSELRVLESCPRLREPQVRFLRQEPVVGEYSVRRKEDQRRSGGHPRVGDCAEGERMNHGGCCVESRPAGEGESARVQVG